MTLKDEIINKEDNLNFFYQRAQEALDAKDLDRAMQISAKGLKEAELKNQTEWAQKFNTLNSEVMMVKDSHSLKTSLKREDITVIKGIGPNVAKKLKEAGFSTITSIAEANISQFTHIPGIGLKTAQKIIEGANAFRLRKNLKDFSENSDIKAEKAIKRDIKEDKKINDFQNFNMLMKANLPYSQSQKIEDNEDYLEEEADKEADYHDRAPDGLNFTLLENEEEPRFEDDLQKNYRENLSVQSSLKQEKNNSLFEVITKPNLQDSLNFQSNQVKIIQNSRVREELILSEKNSTIKSLIHKLRELNYDILQDPETLKGFSIDCDFIGLKVIQVNESLDIILILPIKLNSLKGKVKISNDRFNYIPFNEKFNNNGSSYQLSLNSSINELEKTSEKIRNDLEAQGAFFSYLNKHFQLEISIKKSLTRKNLFFHSGPVQYNMFIEPILVCMNEVRFLEKLLPFPYLKESNLHIINESKIIEFLTYAEKKYTLIKEHIDQTSSLILYEDSLAQFLKNGKKISFPIFGLGFILLIMVMINVSSMLELVVNIGYVFFGVYLISLIYLYIKFFKTKVEIKSQFSIPFQQREFQIDDTRLILISDELTPEMMNQFIYECLGKSYSSRFVHKLEESRTREMLVQKGHLSSIKNDFIFEEEIDKANLGKKEKIDDRKQAKLLEEEELIHKYSSFLED